MVNLIFLQKNLNAFYFQVYDFLKEKYIGLYRYDSGYKTADVCGGLSMTVSDKAKLKYYLLCKIN